jgi:hypothetical protein
LLFVFAFFITRRNASQSGEGKKECEEKRFTDHVLSKVCETGFKVTAGFYLVNKKTRQKTRPQARLM